MYKPRKSYRIQLNVIKQFCVTPKPLKDCQAKLGSNWLAVTYCFIILTQKPKCNDVRCSIWSDTMTSGISSGKHL